MFGKKNALVSIAVALLVAGSASAAGDNVFYLSDASSGAGAALENPVLNMGTGDTATLYIWAKPDVKLTGVSLNVVSSNAAVAEATAVTVYNPTELYRYNTGTTLWDVDPTEYRWQSTGAGTGLGDLVTNISGLTVADGHMLDPDLDGTVPTLVTSGPATNTYWYMDGLYDADADAFLFGAVDISCTAEGNSNLFLQVGSSRIAPASGHSSEISILFGASDTAGSMTGFTTNTSSTVADGSIIPEPATMGLLAMGGIGLLIRRRRR